jgi:hypothetical protein
LLAFAVPSVFSDIGESEFTGCVDNEIVRHVCSSIYFVVGFELQEKRQNNRGQNDKNKDKFHGDLLAWWRGYTEAPLLRRFVYLLATAFVLVDVVLRLVSVEHVAANCVCNIPLFIYKVVQSRLIRATCEALYFVDAFCLFCLLHGAYSSGGDNQAPVARCFVVPT